MIVYCVLGTAPLGADRLASVEAGVTEFLIAYPDAEKAGPLEGLSSSLLIRSAELFNQDRASHDHLPSPKRRRLDR